MSDADYTSLRSTVRTLALQVNTLTACVAEVTKTASSLSASQRLSAHYEQIEKQLRELSEDILRLVATLPPDEPS